MEGCGLEDLGWGHISPPSLPAPAAFCPAPEPSPRSSEIQETSCQNLHLLSSRSLTR